MVARLTSGKTESLVNDGMCKNTEGNEQKTNTQHTLLASFLDSFVKNWVDRFLRERFYDYEDESSAIFGGGGRSVWGTAN